MNKKKVNVIDELIIENPGIETKKEGFPDIGKREDGKDYSFSVKKIEDAWYFNNSLYKIKTTNKVYKFGTGNPIKYKSFPCAVKTLKKQLNKNLYEYPPAAGDETHRQIISDYLKKEGFPNYIDFNNVIITNSTTEGFYLILKSIFKPNDVIIMTSPNYGLFAFMPERLNINVEVIQLKRENDYKIDPRELDSLIKSINNELKLKYDNKKGYVPKVRAFLNINPNNPIGNVLSDKDLKLLNSIGSVCKNNNVFIIDDLIYRDLTYDRKHLAKPIGTIKEYFNNTISLFGLSKSYNLAKTRTGFIVANEVVIRLIRNNVFYIMDSISVIQSSLLAGTFNNSKKRDKVYIKYFKDLIEKYEYSMNVCLALFDGIETIKNTKYYKKILKIIDDNCLLQTNCKFKDLKNLDVNIKSDEVEDYYIHT